MWHGHLEPQQHRPERPLRATGAETVTFTLTDECGNTASTTATFTIEATDPVIAGATDLTVDCDGAGNTTDLNNWLTSNGEQGLPPTIVAA